MARATSRSASRASGPPPISTVLVKVTTVESPEGHSVQRLLKVRQAVRRTAESPRQRREHSDGDRLELA
jgi:hypothetical protein